MDDKIDKLVNYKELYFRMMEVTTRAIDMLVAAKQACEEDFAGAVDKWMENYSEEELAEENWSCYLD